MSDPEERETHPIHSRSKKHRSLRLISISEKLHPTGDIDIASGVKFFC